MFTHVNYTVSVHEHEYIIITDKNKFKLTVKKLDQGKYLFRKLLNAKVDK